MELQEKDDPFGPKMSVGKEITMTVPYSSTSGYGFLIDGSRKPLRVSLVERDSTSQMAGLMADDLLLTVNGHNVKDSILQTVQSIISYSTGSPLTLKVSRPQINEGKVKANRASSLNAYQAAVGDAMRSAQDAFDLLGLSPSKNKDREEKEVSIELDANPSDSDQSLPPSSRSEDDEREEPDGDPIMDFTRGSDEFAHDSHGHFSAAMVGGIIRAQQALQGIKDLTASTKPKMQSKPQVSSEASIEIGTKPLKVKEVSNEALVPPVRVRDQSGVRIEVSVADDKGSGSVVEKIQTRHGEGSQPPPPSRSAPPVPVQSQAPVIHQDMKSLPSPSAPPVPPHSPSSLPPHSPSSLPPSLHSPSSLPPSLPPSVPPHSPSFLPPSLSPSVPPSVPPSSLPPSLSPSVPPSLPPSLPPSVPPSSLPPPPSSQSSSNNELLSPSSNPPPIPPYNPVVPDTFLLSNRPEYQLQVKKQLHSYEDVSIQMKSSPQNEATPTAPSSSGVVLRSKGRDVGKKTTVGEDFDVGGVSVPTPPPPVIATDSPLDPIKASYGLPASVHTWKITHVQTWLSQLNPSLSELYNHCFDQHSITGHTLLHLNQSKLEYIGIDNKDHRTLLGMAVARLRLHHEQKELERLTGQVSWL